MADPQEKTVLKVKQAIDQLRPFLNDDGGDIEFVELTEDNVVKVKMLGACNECSMSHMTLKAGLEDALKVVAPEIVSVIAIEQH
jgi:Fe-S cluster biogenesis protein NfuA